MIVPLGLLLSFLACVAVVSIYRLHHRNISEDVDLRSAFAVDLLESKKSSDSAAMKAALLALMQDARLQDALHRRSRQALLDITAPVFEEMRRETRTTHLYFSGPDRVNILRAHKPDKFGDLIDRNSTLKAEQTKAIAHGIELGPLGTLTLRVVGPWYLDDTLIGYVEIGEEIFHIVDELKEVLGVEVLVFVRKEFLDRRQWQQGMRMLGRDDRWQRSDRSPQGMYTRSRGLTFCGIRNQTCAGGTDLT